MWFFQIRKNPHNTMKIKRNFSRVEGVKSNKNAICNALKIRVSVVRFRPWAPFPVPSPGFPHAKRPGAGPAFPVGLRSPPYAVMPDRMSCSLIFA